MPYIQSKFPGTPLARQTLRARWSWTTMLLPWQVLDGKDDALHLASTHHQVTADQRSLHGFLQPGSRAGGGGGAFPPDATYATSGPGPQRSPGGLGRAGGPAAACLAQIEEIEGAAGDFAVSGAREMPRNVRAAPGRPAGAGPPNQASAGMPQRARPAWQQAQGRPLESQPGGRQGDMRSFLVPRSHL
jgi:hypothetical protein